MVLLSMGAVHFSTYARAGPQTSFQIGPLTRTYYIAADEVAWNYAPSGTNIITGQQFDATAKKYVQAGPSRIGSIYRKCLYRGYTDASFTHRLQRPADEDYLGFLGPVIRLRNRMETPAWKSAANVSTSTVVRGDLACQLRHLPRQPASDPPPAPMQSPAIGGNLVERARSVARRVGGSVHGGSGDQQLRRRSLAVIV